MSYIKKRLQSFIPAFNGIRLLFRETPNARIHLAVTVIVILMGFLFHISSGEWLAIIIMIGIVLATEGVNSAIEELSDYACRKTLHPSIKKVKDLAAAAVLFTVLAAVVVGIIIFLPKIFH